jgi:hypothetical protein
MISEGDVIAPMATSSMCGQMRSGRRRNEQASPGSQSTTE